jgi:hypothetical protein
MPFRVLVVLAVVLSLSARADDEVVAQLKLMKAQLDKLAEKVDSQQQTISAQQKKIDDQERKLLSIAAGPAPVGNGPGAKILERLENVEYQAAHASKLAARAGKEETKLHVEAAVDTAFRYYDGRARNAERPAGNDFSVRSAQLSFSAQVDKHFKSYIVLNAIPDAEEGDEAAPELEEAAIYTTSLDKIQVKGGRFFADFGRLSSFHNHDLPFTTRPRSLEAYVGGESIGDGVQIQYQLPVTPFVQITAGAFNKLGEGFPLLNAAGDRRNGAELTYLFKAFSRFDLSDDHRIEAGVSSIQVPDHLIRRNLNNLELRYTWRPDNKPRLVWGTELMRNELRTRFVTNAEDVELLGDDPILARETRSGFGGYSYLEYFWDRNWSFGTRVDAFQNTDPAEESSRTYDQTYSLFATYRFTDASFIRFEGNRREYFNGDNANEFYLQWSVLLGGHSHDVHDH